MDSVFKSQDEIRSCVKILDSNLTAEGVAPNDLAAIYFKSLTDEKHKKYDSSFNEWSKTDRPEWRTKFLPVEIKKLSWSFIKMRIDSIIVQSEQSRLQALIPVPSNASETDLCKIGIMSLSLGMLNNSGFSDIPDSPYPEKFENCYSEQEVDAFNKIITTIIGPRDITINAPVVDYFIKLVNFYPRFDSWSKIHKNEWRVKFLNNQDDKDFFKLQLYCATFKQTPYLFNQEFSDVYTFFRRKVQPYYNYIVHSYPTVLHYKELLESELDTLSVEQLLHVREKIKSELFSIDIRLFHKCSKEEQNNLWEIKNKVEKYRTGLYMRLKSFGINGKEGLVFNDPDFNTEMSFSNYKNEQITSVSERIKSGIAKVKAEGKILGRPKVQIDVEQIKKLHAEGGSCRTIGVKLGISRTTVSDVLNGHRS